jgi:hypothetical protein
LRQALEEFAQGKDDEAYRIATDDTATQWPDLNHEMNDHRKRFDEALARPEIDQAEVDRLLDEQRRLLGIESAIRERVSQRTVESRMASGDADEARAFAKLLVLNSFKRGGEFVDDEDATHRGLLILGKDRAFLDEYFDREVAKLTGGKFTREMLAAATSDQKSPEPDAPAPVPPRNSAVGTAVAVSLVVAATLAVAIPLWRVQSRTVTVRHDPENLRSIPGASQDDLASRVPTGKPRAPVNAAPGDVTYKIVIGDAQPQPGATAKAVTDEAIEDPTVPLPFERFDEWRRQQAAFAALVERAAASVAKVPTREAFVDAVRKAVLEDAKARGIPENAVLVMGGMTDQRPVTSFMSMTADRHPVSRTFYDDDRRPVKCETMGTMPEIRGFPGCFVDAHGAYLRRRQESAKDADLNGRLTALRKMADEVLNIPIRGDENRADPRPARTFYRFGRIVSDRSGNVVITYHPNFHGYGGDRRLSLNNYLAADEVRALYADLLLEGMAQRLGEPDGRPRNAATVEEARDLFARCVHDMGGTVTGENVTGNHFCVTANFPSPVPGEPDTASGAGYEVDELNRRLGINQFSPDAGKK